MAARRLIVVMLALLVVSSIAAALAPVRDSGEETTTTPATQIESEPRGELVRRTIDTRERKPARIAIDLGDQLELRVTTRRLELVEIAALGELETADPDAPARFDLLPREPGTYDVRLLDDRRIIGSIEVSPRARKAKRPRAGRQSA